MAKTLYWVGSTSPVWAHGRLLDWGDEIDASLLPENDDLSQWSKSKPANAHPVPLEKAAAGDHDDDEGGDGA